MTKKDNTAASVIAFFLSKFNNEALIYLNYKTSVEAFNDLAQAISAKPNYIKLRRDEFDAFFPNGSRQGWNKRPATPVVIDFYNKLNNFSFEELGVIVKQLIEIENNNAYNLILNNRIPQLSEKEIEDIINFEDDSAAVCNVNKTVKQRILNYSIIPKLKKLYFYRCQICGKSYQIPYGVDIAEGHHIDFFIDTMNNKSSNIIILCPEHHRLMHKAKPKFDKEQKLFIYKNGYQQKLLLNYHL